MNPEKGGSPSTGRSGGEQPARPHQTTQRLRDALQCGNEPAARAILAALHPANIADCTDGLEREARLAAFALLSDAVAAEVIDETGIAATDDLLTGLDRERLGRVIDQLETDDAAELLSAAAPEAVADLLARAGPTASAALTRALEYEPDSAGRLMNTAPVSLPGDTTATAAITEIKRQC